MYLQPSHLIRTFDAYALRLSYVHRAPPRAQTKTHRQTLTLTPTQARTDTHAHSPIHLPRTSAHLEPILTLRSLTTNISTFATHTHSPVHLPQRSAHLEPISRLPARRQRPLGMPGRPPCIGPPSRPDVEAPGRRQTHPSRQTAGLDTWSSKNKEAAAGGGGGRRGLMMPSVMGRS